MAESSPLQSDDERQLLQAALDHPFEPTQVPLSSSTTLSPSAPPADPTPSVAPSAEDNTWQSSYASQVLDWRAQSASARTRAERERAKWEAIRAREQAERQGLGQPPESWDSLGDHITTSTAAASHVISHSLSGSVTSLSSAEHVERLESPEGMSSAVQGKTDGSPSQPWEHLSSSQASSYPSMSFPEASVPQSPSHQNAHLTQTHASGPSQARSHPWTDQSPTNAPPSTLPSILDNRVAPRTRLSLVLSSLAINLLLPFINGVMLGFGEIFAKDVVIGWFGWKRHGNTAAGLGLRR